MLALQVARPFWFGSFAVAPEVVSAFSSHAITDSGLGSVQVHAVLLAAVTAVARTGEQSRIRAGLMGDLS